MMEKKWVGMKTRCFRFERGKAPKSGLASVQRLDHLERHCLTEACSSDKGSSRVSLLRLRAKDPDSFQHLNPYTDYCLFNSPQNV